MTQAGHGAFREPATEAAVLEPPVLRVRDLVVEFPVAGGVVTAVDGVSLDVPAGRRIGIVGESGSGKSTLALALLGLLEPPGRISSGEAQLGDIDLRRAGEGTMRRIRGGRIGMIFQDALGSLNPVLTVGTQLREAIQQHTPAGRADADARAVELLREVGVASPERRVRQYPHEFSGGMRQRVMIAMALACDPAILIADEPTTALDVTTQAAVLDLLRRLAEDRGMAVLFITHDLGVVAGFAEDVLVMYAAAPAEFGAVDDVFTASGHPYTQRLMAAVPRVSQRRGASLPTIPGVLPSAGRRVPGCPFEPRCPLGHGREPCRTERPAFVAHGPTVAACHFAEEARATPPVVTPATPDLDAVPRTRGVAVLEVDDLRKSFRTAGDARGRRRTLRAVDGVGFSIAPGESLGLVGESGSGKSTVARLVLGLTDADGGEARFEGDPLPVSGRRPRRLRGRLQLVFQDPGDSLDPTMTVAGIVAEPLRLAGRRQGEATRVRELIELVGLAPEHLARRPAALSGGQRQRVAIARALATEPALVACDEAVSSLDVSVRAQILNLLAALRRRLGLSYLFISHDLSVVRHVCDRVAVMYAGRFMEVATADDLFREPRHPYTIALLSAVPIPDPAVERQRRRIHLSGDPPDLTTELPGCVFASRCFRARERCTLEAPPLLEERPGRWTACFYPGDEPRSAAFGSAVETTSA